VDTCREIAGVDSMGCRDGLSTRGERTRYEVEVLGIRGRYLGGALGRYSYNREN